MRKCLHRTRRAGTLLRHSSLCKSSRFGKDLSLAPKVPPPFCNSESRWVVPSRERPYFGNHRSEGNMLSPGLQPHGFSHVAVGENSRSLPQLPTGGLKRVTPCALARPRVPASSVKFPHCQMLDAVILTPNRDYAPFGCRVTLGEFHADRDWYFEQSFKRSTVDTNCSIGGSRTCPAKGGSARHISLASMPRLRLRAMRNFRSVFCLEKDQAPPPVSRSEDEP
jgi:hypothetical protein